jgi:hypothetical protein
MENPQSLININGTVVDSATVTLPTTGHNLRDAWVLNGNVVEIDSAKALDAWRANAVISQAQARLTLHQLDLLTTVQAIADADPAASIVWEYADVIKRNSPFIDGLGAASFTPEQIDDIFTYAMALVL